MKLTLKAMSNPREKKDFTVSSRFRYDPFQKDSTDFGKSIQVPVSLGGDSGAHAAIAGGFAEAFYGGLLTIRKEVFARLNDNQTGVGQMFLDRFFWEENNDGTNYQFPKIR